MPATDPSTILIKDFLHVNGVRLVEPGTPQWKIKPLQEKNIKLITEYLEQEKKRQLEEEKWAAVPEWKQPLLREKEKKNKELEEAQRKAEEAEKNEREKFESLPQWKQQLLIRKKSHSDIDVNSDSKSESSGGSEAKSDSVMIEGVNGHSDAADNPPIETKILDSQDTASESNAPSAENADPDEIDEQTDEI